MCSGICPPAIGTINFWIKPSGVSRLSTSRPLIALALLLSGCAGDRPVSAFRWGGDAEGGAPFVEADPANPSVVRGFDVEIAEEIARGLGRRPEFVQVAWAAIDQSVERGDFEIGLSGVEDAPGRRAQHATTLPYFEFREVLAVRAADRSKFRTLADLGGRRVATLGATLAWDILLAGRETQRLIPVSYDDDVHPYTDLEAGRVDAVLLDHVIAERALRRGGTFAIQPEPVATGYYVGVLARARPDLRDSIDAILRERIRDGTLERIFRKWGVWDAAQATHLARVAAGDPAAAGTAATTGVSGIRGYLPALGRAAGITLLLSTLAMSMAVVLGALIAAGRVYGGAAARAALTAYVEVVRGTPLLLQLFVIYYGLAGVVRLPAFLAALIGLGLNYAAYEAEIYRSALQAVPRVQLEAARTLGLSEFQVFRLVRGPQAVRFALAPFTNDFVALLKDSSLVSVITVVELTKQTAIYATNAGSWVLPGILCGTLYLAMSLPLGALSRRLERRWSRAA